MFAEFSPLWLAALPFIFLAIMMAALVIVVFVRFVRIERQKKRHEEYEVAEQERIRPWLNKLDAAKHLLTGEDWKSPHGKAAFLGEVLGTGFPQYLWYYGPGDLTDSECEAIGLMFWDRGCEFGDFEIHGRKLRIRNADKFLEEIVLPGREPLPLCQVGYSQFGGPEEGCVNFMTLKPQTEKVS